MAQSRIGRASQSRTQVPPWAWQPAAAAQSGADLGAVRGAVRGGAAVRRTQGLADLHAGSVVLIAMRGCGAL